MTLKVLDLFSGIGGFSLGLEKTGAFKTVAFCEIDKYCTLLLQKHWKGVKVYGDVRTLTKKQFEEDGIEFPDVITGGFPCQPFSVAGKQKGTNDDRHLWPEMFRVIQEFKPTFVVGENVKNIINIQDGVVFETVCADLESEGYEVQTYNIPAAGIGAPHKRERVWIVAYSISNDKKQTIQRSDGEESRVSKEYRKNDNTSRVTSGASGVRSSRDEYVENSRRTLRQGSQFGTENENEIKKENANQSERSSETREDVVADSNNTGDRASKYEINENREKTNERRKEQSQFKSSGYSEDDANTDFEGLQGLRSEHELRKDQSQEQVSWPRRWEFEPDVGRVANGVSGRVHRLKALGNSIVPQIAEEIGKAIIGVYNGDC